MKKKKLKIYSSGPFKYSAVLKPRLHKANKLSRFYAYFIN